MFCDLFAMWEVNYVFMSFQEYIKSQFIGR